MNSNAYVRVEQLVAEALRRGIPNWQVLEDSLEDPEEREALRTIREQRERAEIAATPPLRRGVPEEILPSEAMPSQATSGRPATSHEGATVARRAWGKLLIVRQLGKGAFGDVFLAQDPDLDREVALKLFRSPDRSRSPLLSRADSARGRQAMVREGRLMARVRHPNVVAIYGAEEIAGEAGIWMDFIQGETLHDLVTRQGRLGAREAVLIGLDLCRALAALHARGIVHRDIKAQNVMREEGGRIVLMDFGVGIEVQSPEVSVQELPAGTPLYMSPEMLLERSASPASDQYALGVLLYFLVTGDYPVAGKAMPELLKNHRTGRRRLLRDARPDLPLAFVEVIERATSPEPSARFASMGELEQALAGVLGAAGTSGRGGPKTPQRQRIAQRPWRVDAEGPDAIRRRAALPWPGRAPRHWVVLLAVISVAVCGGLLLVVRTTRPPRNAPVPRQITFHGLASDGEISPDGKSISYLTVDPSTSWNVLWQDVNGGTPRRIGGGGPGSHATSARWNPDGNTVVTRVFAEFDSSKSGVFSFPKEGGAPTRIFSRAAYFAASPKGDRMVAAAQPWGGGYLLKDLRTGNRDRHRIAGRTDWLVGVDWGGPDGQLLFVEKSKATSAETVLAADAGAEEATQIWSDSCGIVIWQTRWAPTFPGIYMLRSRGIYGKSDLVKVDLSKKLNERRAEVLLSGLSPKYFSVSADGRHLALTRGEDRSSIWLLTPRKTADSLDTQRLAIGTRSDIVHQISPDGRSIVLERATNEQQIYTMAIDGTNEIQVTHDKQGASSPSWSPDGKSLAYLAQVGDTVRVCVVPATGGERRVFGHSVASQGLTWSRFGPILYQRPGNQNFHFLDPITEEERPLVQVDSLGWVFKPCVAPDGRRVVVAWNRPPEMALWLIDLETGAERRLTSSYFGPLMWSRDGTGIWVVDRGVWTADGSRTTSRVMRISASDGSIERSYNLPFAAEQQITGAAIAPDESFFVVSALEAQSDIWLVDDFDPDVR